MAKEQSFISNNADLINTAGHTINALQNLTIQKNQKSIAKLQALNLALQKENYDLNEKKVELLQDQKRYFENKKRFEEQNAHIKKLMLKTAPELEDMTDLLHENSEKDNTLTDFLDARFMLHFLEINRGLIEDINFQRLINDQGKILDSITKELDLKSDAYSEELFKILKENIKYFEAISVLLQASDNSQNMSFQDLDVAEQELFSMHKDPVRASIITETLKVISSNSLTIGELNYDDKFLAYSKNFTQMISDYNFFKTNVVENIKHIKQQIRNNAKKELKNYLEASVPDYDVRLWTSFNGISLQKVISLTEKIESFTEEDMGYFNSGHLLQEYLEVIGKLVLIYKDPQQNLNSNHLEQLKVKTGITIDDKNLPSSLALGPIHFGRKVDKKHQAVTKAFHKIIEATETISTKIYG